jgi:low temperature requirement protein LtrA
MPLRRRYRIPRITPELRQRETVKPLELYFDLVFVLAFTQCTALMVHDPTWEGIARGMLVLAMLWWSWAGYAWLTSVIDPEEGAVRVAMFAVMAALLVVSLSVPEAFADRALTFAIAYGVVRAGHLVLFTVASREDPDLRHSVVTLAGSSSIAIGLLVGASFLDGYAQGALWIVAIILDFGLPALFGVEGWKLVPAHFAERHNLIIILALGESIVALGVASEVDLTTGVIVAAALGVAFASAVWWTYFDVVALVTQHRLATATAGRERNHLARDSYSYLHLPMVAGIVLGALGLEATLAHIDEELDFERSFALLGGLAIYLLAHVVLRLRNARSVNWQRLLLALVLFALIPLATEVPALATLAGVNLLIWAMIVYENSTYDERRWRLRHGLDPDGPSPPAAGAETGS